MTDPNPTGKLALNTPAPCLVCHGLNYSHGGGELRTLALADVHLEIGQGQVVILTGPSGSGKTTFMELIGGRRAVQEGYLQVMGRTMNGLGPQQLLEVRRQIGFVFQSAELVASLTAAENVAVALRYQGLSAQQRRQRVEEVLSLLGLERRSSFRPKQLSGGERQRVAVARALAHSPRLILADEPTSLLSHESANRIIELFRSLAQEQGCTSLITTHDNRLVAVADSVFILNDGRISQQHPGTPVDLSPPPAARSPAERSELGQSGATRPKKPKIFLCYRREESEDVSARIYERLATWFGTENIFFDIDTIPPGVDFRHYLDEAVSQCDVLLAVVGDQWLDVRYRKGPKQGQRRLDDEADFVRHEIRSALERGIPVIPVLVATAEMPNAQDLPEGLRDLAYRNATEVRSGRDFSHHVERLIRDIQRLLGA
jgi:putative ABC transport system ATP-binding protein